MPKVRGRPFEKGNKASKGRAPIPVDVKEARKLFGDDFTRALYLTGKLKFREIQALSNDSDTSGMDVLALRWWAKALNGSLPHACAIVERLGSVIPKQVELTGAEGSPLVPPQLESFKGESLTAAIIHLQRIVKETTTCSSTPTQPPLLDASSAASPAASASSSAARS